MVGHDLNLPHFAQMFLKHNHQHSNTVHILQAYRHILTTLSNNLIVNNFSTMYEYTTLNDLLPTARQHQCICSGTDLYMGWSKKV